MFTPPVSPLPSPQPQAEEINPMEEAQFQAHSRFDPSADTRRPNSPQHDRNHLPGPMPPSYFASGPSSSVTGLLYGSVKTNNPSPFSDSSFKSTPSLSASSMPSALSASPRSHPSSHTLKAEAVSFQSQRQYREYEHQTSSDTKRRIGRQIKWTAIAIPAVLILITLSKHCLSGLLELSMGWVNDQQSEAHEGIYGLTPHMHNIDVETPHLPHSHHHRVSASQPTDLPQKHDREVARRQESSDISVSIETGTATATELATPTTTAAPSGTDSSAATTSVPATAQSLPSIPTSTPDLPVPFPQPWDSKISQNFSTQSCYNFFLNMTNSEDFRSCRPFGLLQNTSDDFADYQTNLTGMNSVIWGTCNPTPGIDQCTSNMATFASTLQTVCAKDLTDNNLFAVSTLQALHAYSLTQAAGCLNDPSTNSYCYVKAVHNTNPSDLYFYSLVSGVAISNSTTLTCSSCTKSLMSLYVDALNANASQLSELASVYPAAQALAASACGSTYAIASTNSQSDSSNGARDSHFHPSSRIVALCLASLLPVFLVFL
ncbi:hypothetical protein C8R42DRAFT_727849 [Lentinula raphanica]|nr:hypothetical protein C8R42DRAFT_727849 [Lentinula raphanica]